MITGGRGTVGSALAIFLSARGDQVVLWDRNTVPIDRYQPMEDFVRRERPDVLFHLAIASKSTGKPNESWLVHYEWTSELAWICRQLGVRFVFTSSVMVFSDNAKRPFTVESVPDAPEAYRYDRRMIDPRVPVRAFNATLDALAI